MFESLKDRMKKYKEKPYSENAIYELDGKITVGKAIPFGIQHVLAMFVANIAPILVMSGDHGKDSSKCDVHCRSRYIDTVISTLENRLRFADCYGD